MNDSTSPADRDAVAAPPARQPGKFSLARLSTAFARLMAPAEVATDEPASAVTVEMIIEGILFVGAADGGALSSTEIAKRVRDVDAAEVDKLIDQLNQTYAKQHAAYEIVRNAAGLRMQLRSDLEPIRDRLAGRDRQRKLSPAALEVLAIVAYQGGVAAEEINRLRGVRSNSLLAKLVRWNLLSLERDEAAPRRPRYRATPSLVRLLGLESLGDLPPVEALADAAPSLALAKPRGPSSGP